MLAVSHSHREGKEVGGFEPFVAGKASAHVGDEGPQCLSVQKFIS